MSKFMLSMGLGLASLAGLAGAVEAASSARPVNAPEASVAAVKPAEQASYVVPGQRFGPWSLDFAREKMLDWQMNHGIDCHLEPGSSGWYVVID